MQTKSQLRERSLSVIGIGVGNPDYLTVQALAALDKSDVFFIPDKGQEKQDLAKMRETICERFIQGRNYRTVGYKIPPRLNQGDYKTGVQAWHAEIAGIFEHLLLDELGPNEHGAFLVWGDPSLYDSTLRLLQTVSERGKVKLTYDVIPGITAAQALTAAHQTTLNAIGEPVTITTGRALAANPNPANATLVMLDGQTAFQHLPPDTHIYWGAYLGTPDEILIAGKIKDVAEQIQARRAAARAAKGWIMDTYLVRKEDE
ncbi:precorrin-6A synthase (deacetylating) [Arboricoccus pini]|uniref:precorrin-6A synthase (deacetylating) n=1 Tax=Arboricoccus pini TaxID=1963835 RepID=UPI000B506517|nr:precorrin-6A synthase (deacetylating) [Arboricoccus pini]